MQTVNQLQVIFMKKVFVFSALCLAVSVQGLHSENRTHVLSSDNTSLVVNTNDGGAAYYQYFGPKIEDFLT